MTTTGAPPRPTAPQPPSSDTVELRQRSEPRRALTDPAGTIAVTMLSIVTAIGLCRLFPDWAYLRQLLTVVIGVHAAAAVLRVVRVRAWIALPLVLLVGLTLLSVVYYRETTRFLLPTGDTIDFIRADLRLVWRQFPTAVAPVPSQGSFAMAAAALLAACALLADTFAFRAFGRAEAVVPAGVVFVFTSALGTDRNRIVVSALWIGAAIVVIAVLRFSHAREDAAWMGAGRRTIGSVLPATLACATIAAVAAGLLAPRLPGATSGALFDTHNQGSDATQVLNPLVDIRSHLIQRANVQVFTVQATAPAYWREIALETFDGTQWTPTDGEPLRPATGELADVGAGTPIDQTITIAGLGGKLVPAAFAAGTTSTDGLLFADDTQTVVLDSDVLSRGQVIQLTSVRTDPSPDQLRLATVSAAPRRELYQLPSSFPDEALGLAEDVTAAATNPYDKMIALQDWFRNNFTYDLSVQAGNSDDAIRNFLRIRRGYCEQFSATFAAMARSLGIPARVAVGFTPGELGDDGLYHVYDRHAHAWPEVWFDGFGWISFEPTPGRGEPGAESHTGVAAAQDATPASAGSGDGVGQAATPSTLAPTLVPRPVNPEAGASTTSTLAPAIGAAGGTSDGTPWLVGVALVAAIAAWALWMPRLARSWGRHGRAVTAADRVSAAWRRACGVLRVAGAPGAAGTTPMEYSRIVETEIGLDPRIVGELARNVTRAVYAPGGVDDMVAARSEQLEHQIDELCQPMIPWTTRVLARIDPRVARATG
ncbi:MAG: DUF3488 and transglutaminase-like domain-containing protein [Ilumatobacteraceae bacterium]